MYYLIEKMDIVLRLTVFFMLINNMIKDIANGMPDIITTVKTRVRRITIDLISPLLVYLVAMVYVNNHNESECSLITTTMIDEIDTIELFVHTDICLALLRQFKITERKFLLIQNRNFSNLLEISILYNNYVLFVCLIEKFTSFDEFLTFLSREECERSMLPQITNEEEDGDLTDLLCHKMGWNKNAIEWLQRLINISLFVGEPTPESVCCEDFSKYVFYRKLIAQFPQIVFLHDPTYYLVDEVTSHDFYFDTIMGIINILIHGSNAAKSTIYGVPGETALMLTKHGLISRLSGFRYHKCLGSMEADTLFMELDSCCDCKAINRINARKGIIVYASVGKNNGRGIKISSKIRRAKLVFGTHLHHLQHLATFISAADDANAAADDANAAAADDADY